MKKVLEDELMSLAHRVLKLRNRADIHELKAEAGLLYEKLSILSFTEKHFEGIQPTIKRQDIETTIQEEFSLEHTNNLNFPDGTEYNEEPIYEHNTEKIKDIVSQMPFEAQVVDQLFEDPGAKEAEATPEEQGFDKTEEKNLDAKDPEAVAKDTHEEQREEEVLEDAVDEATVAEDVIEVEDFGVHFDDLPDFEPAEETNEKDEAPKEDTPKEKSKTKKEEQLSTDKEEQVEKPQRTMDLFEQNKKSLNDKLNNNLKIGLNDRLSFVNHLFKGDTKTYEGFIENINGLSSIDEAKDFLNDQIQEKYVFWKDKEEVANRFLHLIEKKFE